MTCPTIFAFTPADARLELEVPAANLGGPLVRAWTGTPSAEHALDPAPLPRTFTLDLAVRSPDNGAKFSPPPLTLIVERESPTAALVVLADAGWHRWNDVIFDATAERVRVVLDLEGHTDPKAAAPHVRVGVVSARPGETRQGLLARAMHECCTVPPPVVHDWWLRPIYCGWGDQVTAAMAQEGVGPEGRARRYCRQELYERWVDRLDEADVPVGTIIIDDGWSTTGSWETHERYWPDLKGFIARQHERGRRVLLWIALWLWEGLPDDWCLRLGDEKLTADPTHPAYQAFIRKRVTELLGPDGYDADGFKIDQLGYVPNERHPRGGERTFDLRPYSPSNTLMKPHADLWGCEMLHAYQKLVYDAAKAAKPDALITSSTVHPYFADTLDMVRLHDMGGVPQDIFAAMQARADLARAALPGKPIDADDWVHSDYGMWLRYTAGSTVIGVPCIFYADRFMLNWHAEPATKVIPLEDLRQIGDAWRQALPTVPAAAEGGR